MVAICTVFFLVELISGYMIHSLALLADAFHMVWLAPLSPVAKGVLLHDRQLTYPHHPFSRAHSSMT